MVSSCDDDHCCSNSKESPTTTCCSHSPPRTKDQPTTETPLTAIIQDSTLHVFDKLGSHRSFIPSPPLPPGHLLDTICFKTHQIPAEFLTPCFDSDFLHGEADEGCACGEDDAHLHAHPLTACTDDPKAYSALTQVVLKESPDQTRPRFEVTDANPVQCNSHASASVNAVRTTIKVSHGDHEDYLAVASDGTLLLAHDASHCCESTDYHGALRLVARRQLTEKIAMTFFTMPGKGDEAKVR